MDGHEFPIVSADKCKRIEYNKMPNVRTESFHRVPASNAKKCLSPYKAVFDQGLNPLLRTICLSSDAEGGTNQKLKLKSGGMRNSLFHGNCLIFSRRRIIYFCRGV